jgi:CheY-like chemotaxis protein
MSDADSARRQRLIATGDRVLLEMTSKHCRILLADDDPQVQSAVRRVAAQYGHEILPVTAGAAVCEIATRLLPDLIVLDVTFPDADGRDLLRQLKSAPQTKDIPVLVWSARLDRESESRIALSLGAEDYVEKSDAQLLLRKIERVLLKFSDSAA